MSYIIVKGIINKKEIKCTRKIGYDFPIHRLPQVTHSLAFYFLISKVV